MYTGADMPLDWYPVAVREIPPEEPGGVTTVEVVPSPVVCRSLPSMVSSSELSASIAMPDVAWPILRTKVQEKGSNPKNSPMGVCVHLI